MIDRLRLDVSTRPLLMYGDFNWNGVRYSRHHLTLGLARRHDVVLVDRAEELRGVLGRPWAWLRHPGLREEMPAVYRYTPPTWLPEVYRWNGARAALERRRAAALMSELGPRAATSAVAYAWHPEFRAAIEALGERPVVYHCYDKYDRYTAASEVEVRRDEEWLSRRAAVCFAASAKLGEHLQSLGARHVVVLRHGVDTELFRPSLEPPAELRAIAAPRIGYVGRINEVLDLEALSEIAEQRPEWSVVLVGPSAFTDPDKQARFHRLCERPNVHYFGSQPPDEIPQWLAGFDVALTCYDPLTWAPYNQPIKSYEYLACGLPVVSTDIEAARELGDLVERSASLDAWIPAIERALRAGKTDISRRLAFAQRNSWQRRTEEIEEALARYVN